MEKVTARILVVDDDDVDVELIFRSFAQHKIGNPLMRAVDGIEALALLRGDQQGNPLPRPYIILLDLNMPRMNGIEFLHTIRQDPALKQSVVFMLTTSDRAEDKLAAYTEQVAGYITKEKAGQDFLEAIQMLDAYQLVVELPT